MHAFSAPVQAKVFVAVSLLACTLFAAPARGDDFYFMMIFATQRHDGYTLPSHPHSFGTFVKATGDSPQPDRFHLGWFTISWFPSAGDVRLFRLPEAGHNIDLPATLSWARENGVGVSMWGPYQIEKELYDRACNRLMELESGKVRYKAIDSGFRAARVSNCIHSLSDIAINTKRLRLGAPSWGDPASYFIAQTFRPWIIDENCLHDWLLSPLCLTRQPLIRRDLDHNPEEKPGLRVIQNIANWHLLKHVQP
jgi:hypothetical protein